MALGIAVPSGSEGHLIQGYAFLEATAPFVVGNDPVELVSGRTPKNAEAELLAVGPVAESLEWIFRLPRGGQGRIPIRARCRG